MPFRDALSRLKGKLKKGLKIGSKDESPTPSSANLSTASIPAPVGLLTPYSPAQLALNAPAASTEHELPSNYIPKSDGHFGTTSTALLGTQPDIRLLDGNPTSQVPRAISDSQLGPGESPLPVNHAVENSTGVDKDDQPAKYPPPENDKVDSKAGIGWTGAKLFLQALNAGVNAIPPLKSAIGELNECFNIYERANKGRNDYGHLLNRTDELLGELQGYIQDREAIEMTQSVKRVCSQLDLEVKSLKAKLEGPTAKQLLEAVDAPDQIMECHGRIQQLLQRLNLNATMNILTKIDIQQGKMNKQEELIRRQGMERRLRELLPALSSTYNSAESDDIKRGGCTQGTRQPQIESLLEWALNPHSGRICWMNGMAGTGKTTIAYSVCSALEQRSALGASFFCSRSIPECRQVKHIIPTIAYQIARYSLPFRFALDKVLESSPDARTQALRTQYEKLIVKPLSEVQEYLPTDFIVVIDALDECENESSLGLVLDLLISPELTLPIRFLVSSRPEPEILSRMKDNARLVLHELDSSSVKSDIETYMRHALKLIPLTAAQWSALLNRCGVLFIYASTSCRYIEQEHRMDALDEAVDTIVRSGSPATQSNGDKAIDELYTTILTAAFDKSRMSRENEKKMRGVLETVICAQGPITLDILARLVGLKGVVQADALLQRLRSVLNVTATTGHVSALHASFPDFMMSPDRSQGFCCMAPQRHSTLAKACLHTIDAVRPTFNICELPTSYIADDKVNNLGERVKKVIPPVLEYASRYWSTHLRLGEDDSQLLEIVHSFFSTKLLIWMEIINLAKCLRFGPSVIQDAVKWCSRVAASDIARIAQDAHQFVSVYASNPVCQSTPHIYVSMLAFWPKSRPVSIAYMPQAGRMVEPTGTAIDQRQTTLLATWKISGSVRSISLSADGTRMAAASDNAIDLLDTSTGEALLHVQEAQTNGVQTVAISPDGARVAFGSHSGTYLLDVSTRRITELYSEQISRVVHVAFSPDGSRVAIGSKDSKAYICSAEDGDSTLHVLDGHIGEVNSVTFSPDGKHVASGAYDKKIRIWDANTGQMVGEPLQGHATCVLSISYSSDGCRLAASFLEGTIQVWNLQTGQTVLEPIIGHSGWIRSVAFSPDGTFIASGSDDSTIRVYDATTGQTILGPLQAHTDYVRSVIVTPDNARLFSCSEDGTIRLWNVRDRHVPDTQHPTVPREFLCVRYSPDGSRVVSGSDDGAVCVWDVQTGDIVLGPLQVHTQAVWGVDYSPNGAYIASASDDSTLRIWSAQDGKDIHGPIQGHTSEVNCVRFSADSSLLVSGLDDRTVQIWNVQTGQPLHQPLRGHSGSVLSIAFSPNRSHVASGSSDRTIRVWDIQTGQTVIDPLQGHKGPVRSVEFSADGSRILSGSHDKSIRIWDAVTGQSLLVFGQGHGDINSVGLSPDGVFVVSGSDDWTVCVWDAQTGRLMLALDGHTHWVQSVQFSPDGSHVVSCSDDGTIRFWDVSSCQAHMQDDSGKDDGERKEYNQIEAVSKPWSLRDDGWVVDRQDQLLVWVPSDLQPHLLPHSNSSIIPQERRFKLDFSGVNMGDRWTRCYQS